MQTEMTEADIMESIHKSLKTLFETTQLMSDNLMQLAKTLEQMGVIEVVVNESEEMQ
jgi:hypothetical protein